MSGRGVVNFLGGLSGLVGPALDVTGQGSTITANGVNKILCRFGSGVTTVTWAGDRITPTAAFTWAQKSGAVPAAIGIAYNPITGQVEMRRNSSSGEIDVLVTVIP